MSRHDWAALSKVLAWKRRPFADLPTIQVRPVPLPEGHPDLDTFDADMAYLARLGRQAWSAALDGGHTDDTTASLYEEMIAELSTAATAAAPGDRPGHLRLHPRRHQHLEESSMMTRLRFGLVATIILGATYAAFGLVISLRDFGIGIAVAATAFLLYGLLDFIDDRRNHHDVWRRR